MNYLDAKQIYEQKKLPVGKNKIREIMNRADFPAIRLGRRIVVAEDMFDAWMKKQIQNEAV